MFEMGTGVTPPPWPPETFTRRGTGPSRPVSDADVLANPCELLLAEDPSGDKIIEPAIRPVLDDLLPGLPGYARKLADLLQRGSIHVHLLRQCRLGSIPHRTGSPASGELSRSQPRQGCNSEEGNESQRKYQSSHRRRE